MDLLERASERVASKRCGSPPFELAPHPVRSIAGKALPFHRRAGLAHHVCMLAPAAAAFSDAAAVRAEPVRIPRSARRVFWCIPDRPLQGVEAVRADLEIPTKIPGSARLVLVYGEPSRVFYPESTGEDRAEFFPVIALGSVRCRQVGQRNVEERGHARFEHPSEDKECGKQLLGLQSLTRCRYPVRIIRLQTVH